jgi:2-polyprenyl-3-methyl-5-hydroxy-6-metoxy-1,4-benzoquinol methylase
MIGMEHIPCALCGADDAYIKYRLPTESLQLNHLWLDGESFKMEGSELIVSCRRCGLVYVNPRIREIPGLSAYSDEEELAYFDKTYRARLSAYLALLTNLQAWMEIPVRSMIDIGCGDGAMLDAAVAEGIPEIKGLEISRRLITLLEDRFKGERVTVSNRTIDEFAMNNFDLVTLINVLEHLHDPATLLNEIQSRMTPGGLLLVHVPNLSGLPARIQGPRWKQLEPYSHLYYFTAKTLSSMLRHAGLTPVSRFHLQVSTGWRGELQNKLGRLGIFLDNGLGMAARKDGNFE